MIIIHHCGIQGSRPRGHTSLSGADDAQIAVERDGVGNIIATVEHMKDGEAGASIVSRLEPIILGNDDDGDPIVSCVIAPVEGQAGGRAPKVTGHAKNALDLLYRAIDETGEPPPTSNHIPPHVGRTCRITTWRAYFYQGTVAETDSQTTIQKTFVRAVTKLQSLGIIGIWNEHVWVAGQPGHGRTK